MSTNSKITLAFIFTVLAITFILYLASQSGPGNPPEQSQSTTIESSNPLGSAQNSLSEDATGAPDADAVAANDAVADQGFEEGAVEPNRTVTNIVGKAYDPKEFPMPVGKKLVSSTKPITLSESRTTKRETITNVASAFKKKEIDAVVVEFFDVQTVTLEYGGSPALVANGLYEVSYGSEVIESGNQQFSTPYDKSWCYGSLEFNSIVDSLHAIVKSSILEKHPNKKVFLLNSVDKETYYADAKQATKPFCPEQTIESLRAQLASVN